MSDPLPLTERLDVALRALRRIRAKRFDPDPTCRCVTCTASRALDAEIAALSEPLPPAPRSCPACGSATWGSCAEPRCQHPGQFVVRRRAPGAVTLTAEQARLIEGTLSRLSRSGPSMVTWEEYHEALAALRGEKKEASVGE